MEENIQINRLFRGLGFALGIVIIAVAGFALFLDSKPPISVFLSWLGLLVLFLPICILGYIPGSVLNKLPKSLVKMIKLDFKAH
jgi:hypothetical protein